MIFTALWKRWPVFCSGRYWLDERSFEAHLVLEPAQPLTRGMVFQFTVTSEWCSEITHAYVHIKCNELVSRSYSIALDILLSPPLLSLIPTCSCCCFPCDGKDMKSLKLRVGLGHMTDDSMVIGRSTLPDLSTLTKSQPYEEYICTTKPQ